MFPSPARLPSIAHLPHASAHQPPSCAPPLPRFHARSPGLTHHPLHLVGSSRTLTFTCTSTRPSPAHLPPTFTRNPHRHARLFTVPSSSLTREATSSFSACGRPSNGQSSTCTSSCHAHPCGQPHAPLSSPPSSPPPPPPPLYTSLHTSLHLRTYTSHHLPPPPATPLPRPSNFLHTIPLPPTPSAPLLFSDARLSNRGRPGDMGTASRAG